MKTRIIVSLTVLAGLMACHTSKKTANTTASAPITPLTPVTPSSTTSPAVSKPANGIYEPGPEELSALQARFSDANLDQLKMGHMIYSMGACIQCHKAMNIYQRSEAQWAGILADMAKRAGITAAQEDAVYKYILAVKAVRAGQQK